MTTQQRVLAHLSAPTRMPLLGKVVAWSLGGIELTRSDLVRRWTTAGLDGRRIPSGIRARSCALRTLEELEVKGFTRRIVESAQEAVWVLVDEEIDASTADVRFAVEQKLVYDKKAKTLRVSDPHFQPTVDALMERFATTFQTADVRTMVLEQVKDAGGLTLRDNGGIYFLPPRRFDVVGQLSAFIEALGPTCSMLILNVPETQNDVRQVFQAFEAEFLGDMDALGRELDDLSAEGDKVRPTTWLRRLKDFQAQREKALMFGELLNVEAARYTARIADLEARVRSKLVG